MSGNNWLKELLVRYGVLAGRILLALIFLGAAFNKITGFQGTLGYMKSQMGLLPDGVVAFLLVGAIAFLIAGGIGVLLGLGARLGALLLFIFLLAVTPIFHAFWGVPAEQMQMQLVQFQKNLAIMGGTLMLMAFGPGPLSIDAWLASRRRANAPADNVDCGCGVPDSGSNTYPAQA